MRHLLQAKDIPWVRPLGQQDAYTAIVLAFEFLDDQTGHQLRLGELLAALGPGMVWQSIPRRS